MDTSAGEALTVDIHKVDITTAKCITENILIVGD
jgi:hypothetical protein